MTDRWTDRQRSLLLAPSAPHMMEPQIYLSVWSVSVSGQTLFRGLTLFFLYPQAILISSPQSGTIEHIGRDLKNVLKPKILVALNFAEYLLQEWCILNPHLVFWISGSKLPQLCLVPLVKSLLCELKFILENWMKHSRKSQLPSTTDLFLEMC